MKKLLLLFFVLFSFVGKAFSQGQEPLIVIETSQEYGETVNLWLASTSKSDDIKIDWGDGDVKTYNIDPNASEYFRKVSGAAKGPIKIKTKLTTLDCSGAKATSITFANQDILEELNLSDNEITAISIEGDMPALKRLNIKDNKLSDYKKIVLSGATSLEFMDFSNNELRMFNASAFTKLREFYANNNAALTTVIFPDGCETLETISMENCDLVHFYPISLPNLSALKLSNNSLLDIELNGHYPSLSILGLDGNSISELDVKGLSKLEQLYCRKNLLKELNITQNTKLAHLFCGGNSLTELNTANNTKLSKLHCDNNAISELPLSHLSQLTELNCSKNKISYVDTHKNPYLRKFYAADNLISFLDFNDNTALDYIDIRNNPNMTACTLNFMYVTLSARSTSSRRINLYLAGSNAEHSNTDYPNSGDMNWKTDVTGDNSATCGSVSLTKLSTENGSYTLEQSYDQYGQKYREVGSDVKVGVPIKVVPKPESGYFYKGLEVDGKSVGKVLWFVVSSDAKVKALFDAPRYATLTVINGTELSLNLASVKDKEEITIDWGDGTLKEFTITNTETRVDGVAAGDKVKISGDLEVLNVESFPGVGWDNKIKGIDVSRCVNLKTLSTYMNPVGSIDVSNCPKLEYLDCSFSEVESLDISNNPNIKTLRCYNNRLSTLDVSHLTKLEFLDAKNNNLTAIDLSNISMLERLSLAGNKLETIDVSNLSKLERLEVFGNKLTSLDLSANVLLKSLNAGNNKLTSIDLSKNSSIEVLELPSNQLASIKGLTEMSKLNYFDIGGNGMSACVLNDIYFALPNYPSLSTPRQGFTLLVRGDNGTAFNKCEAAESILATMKGWSINYTGNGSGCNETYLMIKAVDNGSIKVVDSNQNELKHGSKVAKGSVLKIVATPESGYKLSKVRANGVELNSNNFIIKKATELIPEFVLSTGLYDIDAPNIQVISFDGRVLVKSLYRELVVIYDLSGTPVYNGEVEGSKYIELPKATYIVKVGDVVRQVIL